MRISGMSSSFTMTGRKFLVILLACFALVLAMNVIFVVYALKTWPGIKAGDSYENGLRYNQTLEEARVQKALGWRSELSVAADGEVHARLEDSSGRMIRNVSMFVTLSHRVGDATEIRTSLVRSADGYIGWLDAPAAGYWRATLTASDGDGHRYRMQYDLEIPR